MAQADYHLQLDGIKGESQDEHHRDEIDVLSVSFGAVSADSSGAGRTTSRTRPGKVQDIEISKVSDKSSTALMQFVISGRTIKKGKITLRKAGEDPLEYMTIEMDDVIITGIQVSTDPQGKAKEQVTLSFRKLTVTYIPQGAKGGPGGGATTFVYDASTGTP